MIEKVLSLRWWLGIRPKFIKQAIPNYSLSVVIPAFNEEGSIADTIRSVKNQNYHIDEIYVVDDCSSDKTGLLAKQAGATVIRTNKNQGTKSRALNYALAKIHTDLVVTIDADTLLADDAIKKVVPYFNEPMTFAVCGMVVPQKISTIWERGRLIEYLYGITIIKGAQNNLGLIMVSSGCFTIFRNKFLKELGLFKERSIAEDMDLTWEAHFLGCKVFCEASAVCYPIDPPNMKIYYKQLRRWYSGFLQCLSVHKKDLWKNWKYGCLYSYYLIESAVFPIIGIILLLLYASTWKLVVTAIILHDMLVIIPTLYQAARVKLFWKSFFSIPAFYLTRPVNLFALYVSVFHEWVLNKKLVVWNKGH